MFKKLIERKKRNLNLYFAKFFIIIHYLLLNSNFHVS